MVDRQQARIRDFSPDLNLATYQTEKEGKEAPPVLWRYHLRKLPILSGLSDQPLETSDPGPLYRWRFLIKEGIQHAEWATVTNLDVLTLGPVPEASSAHLAEPMPPSPALELPQETRVRIYTEIMYTVPILHTHVAICKERGLLTTAGTPQSIPKNF